MKHVAAGLGALYAVVWVVSWGLQLALVAVAVLWVVGPPLVCLLVWLVMCVINPAYAKRVWIEAGRINAARDAKGAGRRRAPGG